jgi:hypothetical protein
MIIYGFLVLITGLVIMHVAVYKMVKVINNGCSPEKQIPKWHAFVSPFKGAVITSYREFTNSGPLYKLIKLCWILLALGFVMVIGSRFMAS